MGGRREVVGRVGYLDYARALAIGVMLWAHWHPAAYSRIEWLARQGWLPQVVSRLATPGFVTVFGLTVGVWLCRAHAERLSAASRGRLIRRVGLLVLATMVVAVPGWVELAWSGSMRGRDYCFAIYSILLFYAMAVATLLPAADWIRRARPAAVIGVGAGLWLLQNVLGFVVLPDQLDGPTAEWLRMVFVSGQYAFLGLAGWAMLMVPLGGWLRRRSEQGREGESLLLLAGLGLGLMITGLVSGVSWGELGLSELEGALIEQRNPPRIWFFALFGGLMLSLTAGLGLLARAVPDARMIWGPLSTIGRNSLPIFVGSLIVLPIVNVVQWCYGGSTIVGELGVVSLFLLACAWLVWRDLRRRDRDEAGGARPAAPSPRDESANRSSAQRVALDVAS